MNHMFVFVWKRERISVNDMCMKNVAKIVVLCHLSVLAQTCESISGAICKERGSVFSFIKAE